MTSVNQHASFHQAAGGRDDETHDEQATWWKCGSEVRHDERIPTRWSARLIEEKGALSRRTGQAGGGEVCLEAEEEQERNTDRIRQLRATLAEVPKEQVNLLFDPLNQAAGVGQLPDKMCRSLR